MQVRLPYADRSDAGRTLGEVIVRSGPTEQGAVVLGLPRGGMVVAAEVASVLDAELDVLVVRKLGVPGHAELAFGAVASGGVRVLNDLVVAREYLEDDQIERVTSAELAELRRREDSYREGRAPLALEGRTVLVVDDGLATGATARAACVAVRRQGASRVALAVPVAPVEAVRALSEVADEVVCPATPWGFRSVGSWYADFDEVTDDEVRALLIEG
ncbi:MAG: phosphoribosyltransferase [Nocardioidaceae bacterium]